MNAVEVQMPDVFLQSLGGVTDFAGSTILSGTRRRVTGKRGVGQSVDSRERPGLSNLVT